MDPAGQEMSEETPPAGQTRHRQRKSCSRTQHNINKYWKPRLDHFNGSMEWAKTFISEISLFWWLTLYPKTLLYSSKMVKNYRKWIGWVEDIKKEVICVEGDFMDYTCTGHTLKASLWAKPKKKTSRRRPGVKSSSLHCATPLYAEVGTEGTTQPHIKMSNSYVCPHCKMY